MDDEDDEGAVDQLDDDEDAEMEDEEGGLGDDSRATSPSKLTARQRAKNNKDLQETLIALPNGQSGPGPRSASAARIRLGKADGSQNQHRR